MRSDVEHNVLDLAHECQAESGNLSSTVKGATSPLLRSMRRLGATEFQTLRTCATSADGLAFFLHQVNLDRSLSQALRQQYKTKIARLFAPSIHFQGERKCISRASSRKPLNLPPQVDQCDYDILAATHPSRKEFERQTKAYEHGIKNSITDFDPATKAPPRYFEPFPSTVFENPTTNTPGVPAVVELAVMLHGTLKLPPIRAKRAGLLLLAGIGCGWTTQLKKSVVLPEPPSKREHPGLVILPGGIPHLRPSLVVGRPEWYDCDPQRKAGHLCVHTESLDSYNIPLHPAISTILSQVALLAEQTKLYPGGSYHQAVKELNDTLQNACPGVPNMSPGRLSFGFHGYANSWGFSWADRYVVSTNPTKIQEMALNYTLVSLHQATVNHWKFVNRLLTGINNVVSGNLLRLDPIPWPDWFHPIDVSPPPVDGSTGSWSTPKIELIREMLQLVFEKASHHNPSGYEKYNWQVRLAAFTGSILMAIRTFEVDHLTLSPRQPLTGSSFAQQVKRRPGEEESWIERYIPGVIRNWWWQGLQHCLQGSTEGVSFCLFDTAGRTRPFSLQAELDYVLSLIGVLGMRAYSLRHLGRTLLHEAGLSDFDLALVLNHWSGSFLRHNYARLGADMSVFRLRYNQAADRVVARLGLPTSGKIK